MYFKLFVSTVHSTIVLETSGTVNLGGLFHVCRNHSGNSSAFAYIQDLTTTAGLSNE